MNLLLDLQILGWLLVGLAVLQVAPLAAAFALGEPTLPYAASAAAALFYGLPLALSARPLDRRMRTRDGFVVVSAAWVLASGFGALPYAFALGLSPSAAFFEAVAGFTTTGATVLSGLEGLPRALLLWRSMTQWLGGMGIVVVTIAVLPLLGVGGMQLFRAEMPGPVTDKLTPRISVTAQRLWLIYVGLTLAALLCLLLAGLGPFDAVCHAMTTVATGGFSTRDASVGAFGLPAVEWVVIVFMLLGGINFALHYRALTGRWGRIAADSELRFYLILLLVLAAVVSWTLRDPGIGEATIRTALFQVISLVTTTGYVTTDYEQWPALGQFLVIPMMVLGGMAGSTSGGVKTLRLLLAVRILRVFFLRLLRPFAVRPVRYAGRSVDEQVINGVVVFLIAYGALAMAAGMVVAAAGYDPLTSLSAALSAMGNIGPALGEVGPTDNFSHLPAVVKVVLSLCMIAGRLEIFTLLVLLDPQFWRR